MKGMRKNLPLIYAVLVYLLTVFGISGCVRNPEETKEFSGKKEKVTIGVASIMFSTPLIIAQDKGYFVMEGLDVTLTEYPFGKLALEAMLAGNVDLATVAETPIVFNSFHRTDYSVAATFTHNYDDSKIVVRKDSGIRTASDLRGKMIGTAFGTSAQFFLETYLIHSRILKSDVTVINIPAQDLPAALEKGRVDAIAAFEPYSYEAMQLLNDRAMRLPKNKVFRETFNLAVMNSFIKDHPEGVKRTLRAIDRAVNFIKENRQESIHIISRKLKMNEEYLNTVWDDWIFGLSLDQLLLVTFEDVAGWMIENKMTDTTTIPNYLSFFYVDALDAVNPNQVRIIR